MSTFRVTFKSKNSRQVMLLEAKNEEEARKNAEEAQQRRHSRFPLTFARLDASLESGKWDPLLAHDPRAPEKFTKEMYEREVKRRKLDQARYDDGDLKIEKVEKL